MHVSAMKFTVFMAFFYFAFVSRLYVHGYLMYCSDYDLPMSCDFHQGPAYIQLYFTENEIEQHEFNDNEHPSLAVTAQTGIHIVDKIYAEADSTTSDLELEMPVIEILDDDNDA